MLKDVVTRIETRLRALNLSASAASVRAGLGIDAIRNIERRSSVEGAGVSSRTIAKLAPVLGVSESWLLTGEEPATESQSRRTVPVFGLAAGAITGAHTRSNDPVEFIPCPPGLASVRDAYALIVIGTSMEPRYFAGEVIYIHPHRPVRAGDHVVIQEERDGGIQVSVKLFERTTDEHVVTRQYNPASTVKFLRSRIVAVHRVMTSNELMGI